ncbi:MAG: HPr(Ser) kinase/phosphatase [Elusimicrobiota bacterium]
MADLNVGILLKEQGADLVLKLIAGKKGLQRVLKMREINRPGLALGGYFEHFAFERIQIFGRGEMAYINDLSPKKREKTLKRFFSFSIPCVIVTYDQQLPKEMIKVAQTTNVPLFQTAFSTAQLIAEISAFLEEKLSPTTSVHGVLVDVHGLGVLILGESAIGKSECALELIKCGHILVADDMVKIRQKAGGMLIGVGDELIRHHMELRGLGIIDIRRLFGTGAVLDYARVELVVNLEMWDSAKAYERLGIEEKSVTILGIKLPALTLPVRPGRNLAVLIEVAAMNQRLKNNGQHPARELEQRLIQAIQGKTVGS